MNHRIGASRRTATPLVVAVATTTACLATILSIASASAAPVAPASGWTQTDGNGAAARSNPSETSLSPGTVLDLHYLRSVATPPVLDESCSSPDVTAVAAGPNRLYALGAGVLTAYNARTGATVWSSSPDFFNDLVSVAVGNGVVVVGGVDCESQSDPNGFVEAFDADTGELRWAHGTGSALYSMVVSGDYVAESGTSPGSGTVTSVRRVSTGAVVWQKNTSNCNAGGASVLVVAGQVIWKRCDSNGGTPRIEADQLATGVRSWSRAGDWGLQRGDSDAPGRRHLYARNGWGPVTDLNPANGVTRFILAGAVSVLAVDARRTYGTCGTHVCAFRTSTGAREWTARDATAGATALGAQANGVLYLGDGTMLTATTGASLGRAFIPVTASASVLIVAGGRVAVSSTARVVDLYGRTGF